MSTIKSFDAGKVARATVKDAVQDGISPKQLEKNGVKLLMSHGKSAGIIPSNLAAPQLKQLKAALAVAVEQLAANTQPTDVSSGVTA